MINKMFSNFRHRYNQHIFSQSRHFLIRGLRTKGTFAITLDQTFLHLNLTFSHHPQQPPIAPKFFQAILGKRSIWDFLRIGRRHKRKKALVFTVLGSQGSGKTTLLQHIALILASGKQRRYRIPASVPILLSLPTYLNQILTNNDKPTLAELLENDFHHTQGLTTPTHWFERQLKKGRCFIMLDSFDRVGDEKRRQQVATWLEEQFLNYPRCSFIITARPQGYPSLRAAHILEIQSLETQQIPQFIETWTLVHESTSRFDHGALQRAKQAAKEFTYRLDSAPELLDLATNPLSLTLMAILQREKKQSPLHWLDLYAKTCQLLLEHWGIEKSISDQLTPVQQQAVLQKIALAMLQHQTTQIPSDTANILVAQSLIQYGLIETTNKEVTTVEKMTIEPETLAIGEKFLLEIQNNNGLLRQGNDSSWHFVHQTFQEYLAANQLTTQSLTPEDWFQWVDDSWWYDTLRFYISQCQEVTPIIQACLNNDKISALTLAALTLEIAPNKINQTLQQEITHRFINDLEIKDIKRRRLAAQFLLNYRLHHLQLIEPNENINKNNKYIEIDSSYLTNAEYQLFLDELYAQGYPHQPDHWTEYHFSPGSAQKPITGIRAEDAAAFCTWLTQKQEGKIIYRLPYPMEAKNTPPTLEELATWCQNPYKKRIYGLIWQSKVEEQRISSQLKNFSHLPLSTKSYALVNGEELLRALNKILANVRDAEITQLLTQIITLIPLLLLRDLEITLNLPFILKLALNLDHTNLDDSIYAALYKNDLPAAQQIAKAMQSDTELARQRLGILLDNLLAFALAIHSLSLRQALRKYTVELTQAVWTRLNELEQQQKPSLWQRYPTLYAKEKKIILNLHWWLRVVIAREEGQLPAWEGIRLVRERQIQ
jgi:energy-coupling factor transporter ATP-binding protein EcfA2